MATDTIRQPRLSGASGVSGERWRRRFAQFSEGVRSHVGMSAGAWIAFGMLLLGVAANLLMTAYWAGGQNAALLANGRDIHSLLERVNSLEKDEAAHSARETAIRSDVDRLIAGRASRDNYWNAVLTHLSEVIARGGREVGRLPAPPSE